MDSLEIADLAAFIEGDLQTKLLRDLRALKIIKEADVECAAYFHLRHFIGERTRWRVLARKHARATGHFIDLLIFDDETPAIAIELKWGKKAITTKDYNSLVKAKDYLRVQKTYWISMRAGSDEAGEFSIIRGKGREPIQIVTPLNLPPEQKAQWEKKRVKYRDDMRDGKGRVRRPAD